MSPARSYLVAALALGACRPGQEAPAPAQSASLPVSATQEPPAPGIMHCFSWAHLDQSSTDCYRTRAECEAAAGEMQQGARLPTECRPQQDASCTMVTRPPTSLDPSERCFGGEALCARYRAFVARSGHVTTACKAPSAKPGPP